MKNNLLRSAFDPVSRKVFYALGSPVARFSYLYAVFRPEDEWHLQAMPYKEFLMTTYWRIIRDYVFNARENRCFHCGRKELLNLHHKTYEHHGREHEHLDDLFFLCQECHEAQHKPMLDEIRTLLEELCGFKRIEHPKPWVDNPHYDPRVILNLHNYGDIRGKGYGNTTVR